MPRACLTMQSHLNAVENEKGYANSRRGIEAFSAQSGQADTMGIVTIPVVCHILYQSDEENLSDEQVQIQIDFLNQDFRAQNTDAETVPDAFKEFIADIEIDFALATRDPLGRPTTGITRTETSVDQFPVGDLPAGWGLTELIDAEVKDSELGIEAWPRDQYLNIWVCNMGTNLYGYAAFPGADAWRDGIVINTWFFGNGDHTSEDFSLGRTAVHEVGHWLNLLHIWGDDRGACTHSDNVLDTPNQANSNGGKPTYPSITCDNGPHGDMFMNYMDYVDDGAMVMFTQGQKTRMRETLQGPRASLLTSLGLEPPEPFLEMATTFNMESAASHMALARLLSEKSQTPVKAVFDGVGWVEI